VVKNLTRNGERLTLVLDDLPALRAGANAVKGARFLGTNDGCAVYDYPADAFVAEELALAFEPSLGAGLSELLAQAAALRDAIQAKDCGTPSLTLPVKTTPYAHQVRAAMFAMARFNAGAKGSALLMEQGTGKSLVAIALAGLLEQQDKIEWVLTVCPNTLRGTWAAADGEIALHGRWPDDVHVLEGTRAQRAEQMGKLLHDRNAPWIVTNYEQFAVDLTGRGANGREHARVFRSVVEAAKWRPGLIILDESTYVKNTRAQRTRALAELAAVFPYRLILTGTPITRSPLDAFGQFEVLEKGCLGFNSYLAFERKYAVYQPQRITGGRMIQVPTSFQNLDDLEQRIAALSFRARAADCLDLPPVIVRQIPVTLSGPQAIAYAQLTNDMMAELEGGNFLDGRNILARYGKLAQVVGGHAHMVDGDGRPSGVKTFVPNPKLDALLEYLDLLFEDPDAKAVVFCQYVAEVEQILDATNHWSPAAMYGAVHPRMRDVGRQRFAEDSTCRLMVNQYQCGSKGLNLTAANTLIFYSLTFSLEDYLQAQKRVHRSGQTADHVNEVYLVAQRQTKRGLKPTIDNLILEALRDKKSLADIVTGDRARAALEEVSAL
jgi:SNF2 family DNA or RNA helicase